MARPKRLDGISYTGYNTYFITTCILDRRKVLVTKEFCDICRDELFAMSDKYGFSTNAYVVMPDHIHWEAEAHHENASLTDFVSMFKQRTGFAWRRRDGMRLWQKGYWDRVLRENENPLSVARYIVENPLRARLVEDARDYPFIGSQRYELEHILTAVQMDVKSGWHRGHWRS
jgi:putative transposase